MRPERFVTMVFDGEVGPDAARLVAELERLGIGTTTLVAGGGGSTGRFRSGELRGIGGLAALRRALRDRDAGAGRDGGADRGVDVVHAFGLRAALAVALARPGRTPFVVSLSEAPPVPGAGSLVTRAIHRAVFPAAAAVLVPTPPLAEAVARLGAREVRVIPPPLPDPLVAQRTPEQVREELALSPDGPIVLAVGPLHPDTRFDVLVEAAARWRTRDPRPQVVLVGVGPAYRPLVAQATVARAPVTFAGDRAWPAEAAVDASAAEVPADIAAERTVTAPGRTVTVAGRPATAADRGVTVASRPVPGAEAGAAGAGEPTTPFAVTGEQPTSDVAEDERASLADLLAAASVAVVTDPWAQPGFALAAARVGVALVVAAGGTVAGLFPEGVTTVPPGDAEALDEAVTALLDDAPARADLVAAARRHVAGWPDAAAVAAELAEVYAAVAGYPEAGAAETSDTPG